MQPVTNEGQDTAALITFNNVNRCNCFITVIVFFGFIFVRGSGHFFALDISRCTIPGTFLTLKTNISNVDLYLV